MLPMFCPPSSFERLRAIGALTKPFDAVNSADFEAEHLLLG
jgi:hypothetical protein